MAMELAQETREVKADISKLLTSTICDGTIPQYDQDVSHFGTTMASAPTFRFHKIPSRKSERYICISGPDRRLWFCESGASKIGALNVDAGTFEEFDIPGPMQCRSGLRPARTATCGSAPRRQTRSGVWSMKGEVALFPVPTPNAGPDGTLVGPDGNVWFSESDAGQIGRITPAGHITEYRSGITVGSRPLRSRCGMASYGSVRRLAIRSAASRLMGKSLNIPFRAPIVSHAQWRHTQMEASGSSKPIRMDSVASIVTEASPNTQLIAQCIFAWRMRGT